MGKEATYKFCNRNLTYHFRLAMETTGKSLRLCFRDKFNNLTKRLDFLFKKFSDIKITLLILFIYLESFIYKITFTLSVAIYNTFFC